MPDGETVLPSKGTPQGGILSPLLANIVLNELDWWIASQWDEMVGHMKHPCKVTYYPNGAEKKCNSYTALKKSKAYLFVAVLPCSYFAYAEVCGVSAQ